MILALLSHKKRSVLVLCTRSSSSSSSSANKNRGRDSNRSRKNRTRDKRRFSQRRCAASPCVRLDDQPLEKSAICPFFRFRLDQSLKARKVHLRHTHFQHTSEVCTPATTVSTAEPPRPPIRTVALIISFAACLGGTGPNGCGQWADRRIEHAR